MKKTIYFLFLVCGIALAALGVASTTQAAIHSTDISSIENIAKLADTPLDFSSMKNMSQDNNILLSWHGSHRSHCSHISHRSHYSHRSSWYF